jgi:hypothetical protein
MALLFEEDSFKILGACFSSLLTNLSSVRK